MHPIASTVMNPQAQVMGRKITYYVIKYGPFVLKYAYDRLIDDLAHKYIEYEERKKCQ